VAIVWLAADRWGDYGVRGRSDDQREILDAESVTGHLLDHSRAPSCNRDAGGTVRDELGVPEVTSHSFRKSMADLIDGDGLSARVGDDQLGHAKISMTQDKYMSRGRVHAEVAALSDRTIKDE
jgi:integrase